MQIIFGIFLIAHGIAHLVGFVTYWRIASFEEMPYKTTLLSDRVDVGDAGIRIVGIFWLLTGLAFAVLGIGVITLQPWWYPLIIYLSIFSLLMCILGWPDARFGALINLIILAFLVLANNFGWLQLTSV
ncbi:MAG: ABC transporter permease [Chloroflexota bacterium]|nr:MAG: ABC transporter permease [Chloroflexota bacterium]